MALENAQKEIFKAKEVLREVEGRRSETEEELTMLWRKLKKLNEEKMLENAREDGRRQGLQEGMEMGKEIGYLHRRDKGYLSVRAAADQIVEKYFSTLDEAEVRRSRGDLGEESESLYTVTGEYMVVRIGAPRLGERGSFLSLEVDEDEEALLLAGKWVGVKMFSEIPPDGWISETDAPLIIRLPPPHELAHNQHQELAHPYYPMCQCCLRYHLL